MVDMLKEIDTREVNVGPVTVSLLTSGDVICKQIAAGKGFEPKSLKAWVKLCEKGGTVLDIGAYSGLFSIVAAKLGCHVIAFEAMPKHVERCCANFRLNGVHVDIRYAAVTDKDGTTTLRYNPKVPGLTSGASLIRPSGGRNVPSENRPMPVPAVTIDSLGLDSCSAIKIDVERGEPMVLAGARKTLKRCRPSLLIEVLGKDEKAAVRAALPDYRVMAEMDGRNWLMVPC